MAASAYCKQHETAKISSLRLGEGHIKQVASSWRKQCIHILRFLQEVNKMNLTCTSRPSFDLSAQMLHFCISDAIRIHLYYRLKLQHTKRVPSTFAMWQAISFQTREVKRYDKYHSQIRFLTDSTTYFSHQQSNRSSIWHKINHLTLLLVPESKVVTTQ